jgi:hypothetical protein
MTYDTETDAGTIGYQEDASRPRQSVTVKTKGASEMDDRDRAKRTNQRLAKLLSQTPVQYQAKPTAKQRYDRGVKAAEKFLDQTQGGRR